MNYIVIINGDIHPQIDGSIYIEFEFNDYITIHKTFDDAKAKLDDCLIKGKYSALYKLDIKQKRFNLIAFTSIEDNCIKTIDDGRYSPKHDIG